MVVGGKWGLVVEEEWKRNLVAHNSLQDVHLRLKRCSGDLIRWNARKGRTKDKELEEKSEKLKKE